MNKIDSIINELKNELCSADWNIRSADGYCGKDPSNIIEEKDEYEDLCNCYRGCLELLNDREIDVFLLHMIRGLTSEEVGKELGVTGRTIRTCVKNIRDKISNEYPNLYNDWKSIKTKMADINGNYSAIGYLGTYYRNANLGAGWKRDNHEEKNIYVSKSGCRIPEYLEICFHDKNTKCSFCGYKCNRKKLN